MSSSSGQGNGYDFAFKILLIGDSGVGKTSLIVSFISLIATSVEEPPPTIGNSLMLAKNHSFFVVIWCPEVFWTLTMKKYDAFITVISIF